MENAKDILTGFIYKHSDGTYTIWNVELSEKDQFKVEEIIHEYETSGVSVRDNVEELNLMEVL